MEAFMQEDKTTTVEQVNSNGDTVERKQVRSSATSGIVVAQRIVWFIVGVIITFLALRVALLLLAANEGSPFVDFVYGVGGFFASPFYGIFSYTPTYGKSVLELSSLVAIVIYTLLGWGAAKLLTLTRPHEEI